RTISRTKKLCIHLTDTRETLAEQFGVTRPSLSRELHRMKNEGLINLYKNIITTNNLSLIEQNL
ncbi:helix-turn-helix domain-containing protein, partial [Klebsiella pneumoniae]|uniref:helix-turn-helix domain-containing protein n=1 Tax=Klebsiella pneumoniae TaxID=573 RepID=UPI00272F2713